MIKPEEIEQIKELIKSGFDDLELISFEYGIPLETVKQYKEQIQKEKKQQASKNKGKSEFKLGKIRENYEILFSGSNQEQVEGLKDLTEDQSKLINDTINEIESLIEHMEGASIREKTNSVNNIFSLIRKIDIYPLRIEHLEKLNYLMQSKQFKGLKTREADPIESNINKRRRIIIDRLARTIDATQGQTKDLEELIELYKKITPQMVTASQTIAGGVKIRLENKINGIKQNQAVNSIISEIPLSIENIVRGLAFGELDIEKALATIREEANLMKEKGPKTKFALNVEQHEKRIIAQIKKALKERVKEFPIEDPEITTELLQKLSKDELEYSIKTVVTNLVEQKEFVKAKDFCDKYFDDSDMQTSFSKYIYSVKKEIRNAQIGDMILKGIHMTGTIEEQEEYFELIEKGIQIGNIDLRAIPLGKSQNGSRNITLADIWYDKSIKGISK